MEGNFLSSYDVRGADEKKNKMPNIFYAFIFGPAHTVRGNYMS